MVFGVSESEGYTYRCCYYQWGAGKGIDIVSVSVRWAMHVWYFFFFFFHYGDNSIYSNVACCCCTVL